MNKLIKLIIKRKKIIILNRIAIVIYVKTKIATFVRKKKLKTIYYSYLYYLLFFRIRQETVLNNFCPRQ